MTRHIVKVPVCSPCLRHARLRDAVEANPRAKATLYAFVVMGLIFVGMKLIGGENAWLTDAGIMIVAFVCIISGPLIYAYGHPLLLGEDYMTVMPTRRGQPEISFTNEHYQALFEQVNPSSGEGKE